MLQRLSPRLELVLVNLICFGPFAAMSVSSLLRREHHTSFTDARLYEIVAIELACGALAVLLLRARGWTFSDLSPRFSYFQMMSGMALLIVANVITVSVTRATVAATGIDLARVTTYDVHVSWPAVVLLALVNPLYEELFEVAYNVKMLESHGAAFAITISALIRFVCHLYQGPIAATTILPLGLVFAFVYWRWRTIWPVVVAHGAADTIGFWPG